MTHFIVGRDLSRKPAYHLELSVL